MECLWYVISYFALTHIAGLFLGMYLERKITQLSMLKNCIAKSDNSNNCSNNPSPMLEPKNTDDF